MGKGWINKRRIIAQIVVGLGIIGLVIFSVARIKSNFDTDYSQSYGRTLGNTDWVVSTCGETVSNELMRRMNYEQVMINEYTDVVINYDFGDQVEVVDKNVISHWVSVEDGNIVLDKQKVAEYVDELAQKYDTVGKERNFVNSHGEKVIVSGGTYGWKLDKETEIMELCELIEKGTSVSKKEPNFTQTAMVKGGNDIGNTYIEVNIAEQKMWYYKDGELIVETDIVTGNYNRGRATPTVVGFIYNKARNRNLVGADYVAFVHYWMKVYGSIGIHDASWRKNFGGNIYASNGSHGCINTPYENVKKIYDTVEIGTPVIIFNEE